MDVEIEDKDRTVLPRFTIRSLFVLVTLFALVFVVAGMAYRGQYWAWGVTIGVASLAVTALVHAACFGLVWMFARLPATREKGNS